VQGAEASIFDLVNAVSAILQRVTKREDQRDIFEDKFSVSQKIEHLMKSISERPRLRFSELFEGVTSRSEVVCTFLALLELIRLKQILAMQTEAFGEIEIARAEPAATAPARADAEPVPTAVAAEPPEGAATVAAPVETASAGVTTDPESGPEAFAT
jgi:segregation and condensation protein A